MSNHPLQSIEWGEFRKKTGVKVIRGTNFQLTIHKISHTSWTIGYLPKGPMPTKTMMAELREIGIQENCIFIQLEPNIVSSTSGEPSSVTPEVTERLRPSAHPLFTRYTFQIDLTKSEEELLKNLHPKTRYNIKVAQKHGVKVVEDNSDEAFEQYLKLVQNTTKRQKFYAHDEKYHRLMWETLKIQSSESRIQNFNKNKLAAHLLIARYKNKPLVAWILFVYKDTLYYPYGASSNEYKEVMASNLMMWEAIKFGKKLGLKKLDMWGSLGPNPNKNDPWYGFHRFKEGYGGKLIEFVGSYDLVINPLLYQGFKLVNWLRWFWLRIKK